MLEAYSKGGRRAAARRLIEGLGTAAGVPLQVRLGDACLRVGPDPDPRLELRIQEPGVLGALLRRPTAEHLVLRYAAGHIDVSRGTLLELIDALESAKGVHRRELRALARRSFRDALLLLTASAPALPEFDPYPRRRLLPRRSTDDRDRIAFHYDLPNEFFELVLGPEMQYSCAHFVSFDESLEEAQRRKLDLVCRKLRLEPGERFLDIGCGWGGLVCHAAQHHGVRAHGVTLSREQAAYASEHIRRLGLADRVRVECGDFTQVKGRYDKLACVEMYEHVGLARLPSYFAKLRSLLEDGGLLLHQAICNRSKGRRRSRSSRETQLVRKYVLPGLELADPGLLLRLMEQVGFEIQGTENLRRHYARTARLWVERLEEHRARAVAIDGVGEARYRLVMLCLTGLTLAFERGSNSLFRTVAAVRAR